MSVDLGFGKMVPESIEADFGGKKAERMEENEEEEKERT